MPRRTPSRSHGRLPASVYWRRRLAVLSIGVLLVVGLTRLIAGGGDDDAENTASTVAGKPAATVTVTPTPSTRPTPTEAPTPTAPAQPVGFCKAADVAVKPDVKDAYAYDNVTIALVLHTVKSPACIWKVSADALQVRISSKSGDPVWGTVDCPQAVPDKEVVVRRDSTVTLPLTWSSRRVVAGECTSHGPWVKPGRFVIVASSLGGEPATGDFALHEPGDPLTPPPSTSPSVSPSGSATSSRSPSTRDGLSPSSSTTGSTAPSGPTRPHRAPHRR